MTGERPVIVSHRLIDSPLEDHVDDDLGLRSVHGRTIAGIEVGALRCGDGKELPTKATRDLHRRAFLDLLDQMEALTITVELDWPDHIRTDAQRRLNRLVRALRHAPENRERLDV
jgi:hypothetical protein